MAIKSPKEQVEAILDFAGKLQSKTINHPEKQHLISDDNIRKQIDQYLNLFPLPAGSLTPVTRPRFDHEGTKLWNNCVRLMAMGETGDGPMVRCKVKALAFVMIEAAAPIRDPGCNRALETAFRLAMTCIEQSCLDLSQKIIETVAVRLDKLEKAQSDIEKSKLQQFNTEYYMLRVYLSWFQGRPDIADHLFSKIPKSGHEGQGFVMDICYKVGSLALSRKQYDVAAKWLGRALESCEWIVRANLHLDTAESKVSLARTLESLKVQYGCLFPVRLIQLEVLSRELNWGAYIQGRWNYSLSWL
ncbi:hypothetical protein BO70DRAFT_389528 [Aspergillus heteromorphus CBS 117.55]|uniref:Protein ZIP4 homolog n=1 Tax=Aspergillus heteromorphus CBS 117.55 TaxID=1448321 RepID=A0A317VEG5_9EURO|nr:uncharacterized protein BO70DRAFT_389528 [Aspergillus heteromorphus CBS 117.55]PWY71661.1 hypothetical protein BO70DRAFT_389528 [Aspergillus heteromorphus CBS 117.55]